ncbi:MAG: hypothetical protein LBT48_07830 [Prevotellaceae bacterium]|jgi:hypothetical protein|nr:hypothetical protein [Prevotellaceae bacterium]
MAQITGIKYTNDLKGNPRYVRVDLKQYGNNELLEDFLDSLEIEARKGEETVSLEVFNQYIDKKLAQ